MIAVFVILLIIVGGLLVADPNDKMRMLGKIFLGIAIIPVVAFILFFATCLVMIAGPTIFR